MKDQQYFKPYLFFFFNAQVGSSLIFLVLLGLGLLSFSHYLISALSVYTTMAIFSALMLYGVNKKKANFMTPYIYVMLIIICLALYMIESVLKPYPVIGGIVGGFLLLEFYFIRVVKLHKEEVSFFMSFCYRNLTH